MNTTTTTHVRRRRFGAAGLRRGFTLVEILAVVVILGITSAIIIPQMGTRDDMRVSAAARTLVADLIYAQNQAISTGSIVWVKFDTTNNQYTLLSAAKPDVSLNNPVTQSTYLQQFGASSRGFETVSINSATFNGLTSGYSGLYTVGFDEIGSPWVFSYTAVGTTSDTMNDGSIVLKCGNFTKTITISPATGEITVN